MVFMDLVVVLTSRVQHPLQYGALRSSYPTPSAGTFTVHRNTGGSCPTNDGWQGAGGGGAGNTGAASGIDFLG